ncbi:MAG: precorrin-6y C5,15-methyltransferase (decarboxylating) subunit CbiE, partial [Nitrospirae bacterium]|nr:precorrin-6y C5,15-methyltransferase (decarboxylating) subunit CbiE [Nitrospirota bacterium]
MEWIHIIGIGINGKDDLLNKALEIIKNSDILFGGERHLSYFSDFKGERFVIKSNLKEVVQHIKENRNKKITVLASGDPNFYGIADYLIKNLKKDDIEIIPNISSMQWAFAKIKEPWHDAVIVSSHGRDIEGIVEVARHNNKIGVFTSTGDEPKKIAEALLKDGLADFNAYICEDIGSSMEKITTCSLNEVRQKTFSPLNIMILILPTPLTGGGKGEGGEKGFQINAIFGFPDDSFIHSAGMITKEEIRAISLSKMRIRENSVIWDIGSGSGSIAIEAGRLAKMGKVYAIEKKHDRIKQINENIKKISMKNIEVIEGEAPDCLKGLTEPDAVFIGGSSGRLKTILEVCSKSMKNKGRIIINAI